ncbi:MAG TPA: undecaprenyldiphospho-muramoylpentapeptide beta-N-acetylglucosaminyltransferase [Candidatus Binatia bacterium]|nr:undecaprenyldiphospho-muramoylpentapeptide beta-N-acetylglucosaminyltransferase [Candidatus Binatia bacterium]
MTERLHDKFRLAIAGGGTGGHLFPGLAVAELARDSGAAEEVVFFGAERGIEFRVVPKAGFPLVAEKVHGIAGGGALAAVRSILEMLRAAMRARRELRSRRIDVVIGLGGYASAPAVLAARLGGIPVVLLEQNREPGISNRALGQLATRICTSFESTARFPRKKVVCTGNPLRSAFGERPPYAGRDMLLVFGGSGGARSLNRAVVAALAELSLSRPLLPILHQVGHAFVDEVRDAYAKAGVAAEVVPFIEDMHGAYSRARLAICRSGATSIAELVATGTPSLLIPLAHSAGGHQLENARELEKAGASIVILDDEKCAAGVGAVLGDLLPDTMKLTLMSDRAAALGRPGAAARVLRIVSELARDRRR